VAIRTARAFILTVYGITLIVMLTMGARAAQISRDEARLMEDEHASMENKITTNTEHLVEIDRRLERLENYNLDTRLARVETTNDINKQLLIACLLALMGLILERILFHSRLIGRPAMSGD